MRLDLGINTCFAVKRWPLPSDWAPLVRDCLHLRIVEHSFDLVDVKSGSASRQAEAVRLGISTCGLEVRSTFTGLAAYSSNMLLSPDLSERNAAMDWYRSALSFSQSIGAIATGGHVGAYSVSDWGDPEARSARWRSLHESLQALAADARAAGQTAILVENLASEREPSTMAMVRDLLMEADESHAAILLALDVGHMCVSGTYGLDRDPYSWLRRFGRVAFEVQLQQTDASGDHHWPFTPAANSHGRINADRVIDALGEGGVDRLSLILEIIPPFEQNDASVLDDLIATVDYWKEALSRRGVLNESPA